MPSIRNDHQKCSWWSSWLGWLSSHVEWMGYSTDGIVSSAVMTLKRTLWSLATSRVPGTHRHTMLILLVEEPSQKLRVDRLHFQVLSYTSLARSPKRYFVTLHSRFCKLSPCFRLWPVQGRHERSRSSTDVSPPKGQCFTHGIVTEYSAKGFHAFPIQLSPSLKQHTIALFLQTCH